MITSTPCKIDCDRFRASLLVVNRKGLLYQRDGDSHFIDARNSGSDE